jgi:hypothetical protein
VIRVMSDGLVTAVTLRGGMQLWHRLKMRGGKRTKNCPVCRKALGSGDTAWAEVTQCAMNRAERICDECMQREIEDCRQEQARLEPK